jgi:organic radical activating enzyme
MYSMDQPLKTFKIKRLDSISPTFCAAKWMTTDIYLHTGLTSSCHYPVPGPIDLLDLDSNLLAVHNTKQKILQRQQMLNGQQPAECSNCWNIENSNNEVISDRVYYSKNYEHQDFTKFDLSDKVVPEFVTIMVDNYCNFTCSYCDPTQSTSWATDLKINGPYKISTDPKKTYQRLGSKDRLSEQDQNSLFDHVVKMVTQNLDTIKILNILGGEPTINPKFWKLLDLLADHDTSNLTLSIVTNFSNWKMIEKFLLYRSRFKNIKLIVSIDGTDKKAEFVRYGLNWQNFNNNVHQVLENYPDVELMFIGTVNILALDGLIDYCNWYLKINRRWPNRTDTQVSVVRWPNFQAITVLPDHLKIHYKHQLRSWIQQHRNELDNKLITINMDQIIELLGTVGAVNLEQIDFKNFVLEYSKRHNLDVKSTFSNELSRWIYTKD